MRRKLRTAVVRAFAVGMKEKLPQFQQRKVIEEMAILPGDRLYEWRIADTLSFYIVLRLRTDADAFTIEIAWSRTGGYPSTAWYFCPRDWADKGLVRDRPEAGEIHFRLCRLWEPKEDIWWELVPPCLT